MKRLTSRVIAILLVGSAALVSAGCTAVPEGVEPISGFSLDRYLGTWYEIARLDHRFERGLSEVTATYSRRDDGGVRVVMYNKDHFAEAGVEVPTTLDELAEVAAGWTRERAHHWWDAHGRGLSSGT